MFSSLLDISFWRKKLGFFPHALFQRQFQHEKYILLNGKGGNFCVDYTNENPANCRSYAWSANVGHYITINEDKLRLYRWDKPEHVEELSVGNVSNRIESFNDYLAKQQFDTNNDIIRLALNLYREIRSSIRDKEGEVSLNALLCVLAAYEDKVSLSRLNKEKWGLAENSVNAAKEINKSTWDRIHETLNEGTTNLKIKPNVELLLRHASGKIFKEAHFESVFSSQLQFEFGSQPMHLKKLASSFSSHYTPTSIVRSIVEETLRDFQIIGKTEITIFDPAVGSGEFLKESLRQLNLKDFTGKVKLIGWDISQSAIDLANFCLHFEKQSAKNSAKIEIQLEKKNALTVGNSWSIQADIILMNPPFKSWENMSEDEQSRVENILGNNFNKRPNQAGAFLWKAANSLNDKGRLGCIIPSSILEADSFKKLRVSLGQKLHIDFLAKLGSHTIFEEAISAPSILISTNGISQKQIQLMWSDNTDNGYAYGLRELRKINSILVSNQPFIIPGNNFNFYSVNNLESKNWMPVDMSAFQLINFKLKEMPKVKDLFDIKQGVRTGLNKAFIINKEFFETLPKSEQKYFRPAVTNDSIKYGCLNDNNYIFYAEGKYSIKSEAELKKVVNTFYTQKFSKYIEQLSARSSIQDYWELTRHRKWLLDIKPKIVSKEFGLAGSFAFDEEGNFVAERSHAWLPKNHKNWNDIGHAYVAVLCMNIVNDLLKGISKQILSGSYYLSSQYINDMPLPNLFNDSVETRVKNELIKIGKELSKGNIDNDLRSRLEELTSKVFNG